MSEQCVFCAIASGEIPADLVAQAERWVAFRDLDPQAPTHVLVIPRDHLTSLNDFDEGTRDLAGELLLAAREVAELEGLADDGYRVVANTMERAGQPVFHLHLHVLGGRAMRWPPG
jgi:histidine triad (HIT) family protein